MRLWHQDLLPLLPAPQILGQHRECCALRGKGWGRPHSTVNYVFTHPRWWLWLYHMQVMYEMLSRGYHPDVCWYTYDYRGKNLPRSFELLAASEVNAKIQKNRVCGVIYPEHNYQYLTECIDNLKRKGKTSDVIIEEMERLAETKKG